MAQDLDVAIVKDFTTNGITTLATAGKYCDRNIEINVNVPIPSGYIKPSGSKSITENGTHDVTNYASAVVNVPQKATQFTNLYDPANVTLKTTFSYSGSTINYSADNYVNYILIPYYHKAGEPVEIRVRGISSPVRDRQTFITLDSDGTTMVYRGQFSSGINVSYDEYGDMVCACKTTDSSVTKEWYYMLFAFQYTGINSSASTAYTGPIITINEPIGNGGYTG